MRLLNEQITIGELALELRQRSVVLFSEGQGDVATLNPNEVDRLILELLAWQSHVDKETILSVTVTCDPDFLRVRDKLPRL